MHRVLRVLLPWLFGFVCAFSPAVAGPERILIVNEGEEAIYSLAMAPSGAAYSADLLGPVDVVGIGEARWIRVPGRRGCSYDVRATYGDGHTADRLRVNVCVVERIAFA